MHRKHPLPVFLLVAALALLPLAAPAQTSAPATPPGGPTVVDRPALQPDTALGAFASIGCGFFVRATLVTAGSQVGTIVGAVACCGYMLFDALVVEPH